VKSLKERRSMIEEKHSQLSIVQQCNLLSIHRSVLYYTPCQESEENLAIMRLLDEQYFRTPFYGIRRLTAWLQDRGYNINRKRVKRLMQIMGWKTIFRAVNTSEPDKQHKVYPYLLKGININKPNQVWATDITYVPMRKGFMYLCAIIDIYSRYVLNWSISNTMTADWCTEVLQEAIDMHGKPEILNSDQGSQFTSEVFTGCLIQKGIKISMDGKGRALDNIYIERLWRSVKYEHVYLYTPADGVKLYEGLNDYFKFYNQQRLHQSLGYHAPEVLYRKAA
jgi:putative transposase